MPVNQAGTGAPTVALGGAHAAEPVRTGWSAPVGPAPEGGALDQLTDVSTPAGSEAGSVLTLGLDGIWRPAPVPSQPPMWGDSARWRRGAPGEGDTGPAGAVHVDLVTGELWRYIEDQEG